MVAKRGRPKSEATEKLELEKEQLELRRNRIEDMFKNPPRHIKKLPISQLMQELMQGNGEAIEKQLLEDYRNRPLIPPDLIFALNDLEVSPLAINKYKQYLNAPKKGAEVKRDKRWGKVKEMCERVNNKILIDRISPSDLTVNAVAKWIHDEWSTRGIDGAEQKSVRQIRRDIESYLQQ